MSQTQVADKLGSNPNHIPFVGIGPAVAVKSFQNGLYLLDGRWLVDRSRNHFGFFTGKPAVFQGLADQLAQPGQFPLPINQLWLVIWIAVFFQCFTIIYPLPLIFVVEYNVAAVGRQTVNVSLGRCVTR